MQSLGILFVGLLIGTFLYIMSLSPTYKVKIFVSTGHSPQHASLYLPTAYPPSIKSLLERPRTAPDWPKHISYTIPRQSGSTSLAATKVLLQEQHAIPVSVQLELRGDSVPGADDGLGKDKARDEVTRDEVWWADKEREVGTVYLLLVTTAGRIGDIVSIQHTDGLVLEMLRWRGHIGALRYLHGKAKPAVSKSRVEEHEALERASAEQIRKMIQDWDRIVCGIEKVDMVRNSNQTADMRECDIEAWFDGQERRGSS